MLSWQNSAWEFKERPPKIAILPLANQEPHGPYLPVGTDQFIVSEIAWRVAGQSPFPAFLLPVWPFGTSVQAAGAISLGFETLWAVVGDIVLSLYEHDIHHVVVINNHGSAATSTAWPAGNVIVKTAVRQLNYETPGLRAIWVQPFAAGRRALNVLFPAGGQDASTSTMECSILMHLTGRVPEPAPDGASAEKGKQVLEVAVKATVEYIQCSFEQLERMI